MYRLIDNTFWNTRIIKCRNSHEDVQGEVETLHEIKSSKH